MWENEVDNMAGDYSPQSVPRNNVPKEEQQVLLTNSELCYINTWLV